MNVSLKTTLVGMLLALLVGSIVGWCMRESAEINRAVDNYRYYKVIKKAKESVGD